MKATLLCFEEWVRTVCGVLANSGSKGSVVKSLMRPFGNMSLIAWMFGYWGAFSGAVLADMLPSGLSVPSSVYGASYGDVTVPDAGAAVGSAINISGAPAGAIVTSVQVAFDVVHEYPGDLAVWLVGNNSAGQQRTRVLWNPGNRTESGLVATTVTTFNGAAANQSWQLILQDTRTGDVGYLDQWSIRVTYLAPPALRLPGTAGETGYLIGTLTPSLQWNTAFGATRYRVRAQANPYDALSTVYEGTINGTSGTAVTLPPGRLLHGGAYRWLATSITGAGVESGFGVPLFFATPPAGVLVTPVQTAPGNSGDNNRAFLPNAPPTFQWQSVVGATGYKVRVSEYPYGAGNEVLAQFVGLATSFTPAAVTLIPGVRYRWTVTGFYLAGKESTPWQSVRYFEMVEPAAPQLDNPVSVTLTRDSVFSLPILASNAPTDYAAVDLPPGLAVNAATGEITGAPTETGIYQVLCKATNAFGSGNQGVLFNVVPPAPVITSPTDTTAFVGRPFDYQILATEDPTAFAIDALRVGLTLDPDTGLLTGAFAAAGTYALPLHASNSGGIGTQTLTVVVTSGGPYDTKLFPRGVHENQPLGTVVGNFTTLDGEGPQPFIYALVAGVGATDNAFFEIRPGEAALRTLAVFDYEARNAYSIRVRTTDTDGQSFEKQITIRVLNVIGESQGGLQLSDATVLENRPAGTLVGFQSAVDPDPGETFTFTLVGGADVAHFTIVGNQLKTALPLDFEAQRYHTVRIRVTDSGANALEETAIIEVLDDTGEDFDQDGLKQAQEVLIGTSDLVADSDGDGAGDGREVAAGTNPLNSADFADGAVVAWGLNSVGQCNVPGLAAAVVAVSAGAGGHSIALQADGKVAAWGSNFFGQTAVPAGLGLVVDISTGDGHTLALKADGTVHAWGLNDQHQCDVPGVLTSVAAFAAGENHSVALKMDGTVVAWGDNSFGQTTLPGTLNEVAQVSAGGRHTLALKTDGTVVVWGDNSRSQCQPPGSLTQIAKIAAGAGHFLALKQDGTVATWGDNSFGATNVPAGLSGVVAVDCGSYFSVALKATGTVVAWGESDSVAVPAGLSGVTAIACGSNHTLALKSNGTVAAWGLNSNSECAVPAGLSGVVAIAAGNNHSLALKSDGTVVGWGTDIFGQATAPDGLDEVVAIAAGVSHSLALKSNGTVIAWGQDDWGQATVPAGLSGVVAIAADTLHNLALKSDGTVVAWGSNIRGETTLPAGLIDVVAISAGSLQSMAVTSDGSVVAWGDMVFGGAQEGIVAVAAGGSHSLALKEDGTVVAWGSNHSRQSTPPVGLGEVQAISGGGAHSLALKTDGTVVAWGENFDGQTNVPLELDSVVAIAAGLYHSLTLKSDGTVVAWGSDSSGQASVPAGLSGVIAISAGNTYSLAMKSDGTAVAWGRIGNSNLTTVPVGLSGLVAIAGGSNHSLALRSDGSVVAWGDDSLGQTNLPENQTGFVAIAAGSSHSLALKSDGTVLAWGTDAEGVCSVPSELSGVVAISGGDNNSLAVKADGTVVVWGSNSQGQRNVPDGLTGVTAVAAGYVHCLARKMDGTVVAWGGNGSSQSTVPVGLTNVIAIDAGRSRSIALRSDGTVVAWGQNLFGEGTVPADLTGAVAVAASDYHSLAARSKSQPPRLQNISLPGAAVGEPYSFQIPASGNGLQFSALSLPPGLSVDSSTGVISGAVTEIGISYVRLSVQNNAGRDVRVVPIVASIGRPVTDLLLSHSSVSENQPAGTLVGLLSAVDADPGETFAFSVVSGADIAKFAVVGNQLRTAVPLDFEVRRFYNLRLRVTDSGGNVLEKTFTVEALDDDSEDFDQDGLTQAQEAAIGTSDLNKDTDGDGSGDGPEVWAGTNPLDSGEYPDGTVVAWGRGWDGQTNVPGTLTGVVAISAAGYHSLALKSDGTVVAWGNNFAGVCNVPAGLSGVVEVAAGARVSLALKSDGTVVAWGHSSYLSGAASLSGVVSVAAGRSHALALKGDGTVVAWGSNIRGQTAVPGYLRDVIGIASGSAADHSLALRSDGSVVAWGYDYNGQATVPNSLSGVVGLSAGAFSSIALKSDGTVVEWRRTSAPAGLSGIVAVAAGAYHSLGLKSDRTVTAWGDNNYGEGTIPADLTGVVAIAAGDYHSLAVRSMRSPPTLLETTLPRAEVGQPFTHQVPASGAGLQFSALNLPPGLSIDPSTGVISGTPSQIGFHYVRLTVSNSAGLDVKILTMAASTGNPVTNLILSNSTILENQPAGTVVGSLSGVDSDPGDTFTYSLVGGTDIAKFAVIGNQLVTAAPMDFEATRFYTLLIRVTDSGGNVFDKTVIVEALDDTGEDFDQDGLTQAQEAAIGTSDLNKDTDGDGAGDGPEVWAGTDPFNSAEFPDGTVVPVGQDGNPFGYLDVPGVLSGVVSVSASQYHSVALKADGSVSAWGYNYYGQSAVPAGLTNVVDAFAGHLYSIALRSNGTVVVWGGAMVPASLGSLIAVSAGSQQALGIKPDGTVVAWSRGGTFEPVPASVHDVIAVSAGNAHNLALKYDGTVVAWGDNSYGQLAVPSNLSGVIAIAAGDYHSLALKADGTVVAWGSNQANISTVPLGVTGAIAVSANYQHSLAVTADGGIAQWGSAYSHSGPDYDLLNHLDRVIAVAAGHNHALALRSINSVAKLQNLPPPNARLGESYSHQLAAAGSGVQFSAMNLPLGLSLDPATGIISGTATQIGRYFVRLTAQNSAGRDVRIVPMSTTTGNPPTAIGLTGNVVAEDVPVGTVVARLTAAGGAGAVAYSLVDGTGSGDNGKFEIMGDLLVTTVPLDYEAASTLSVRVRAEDSGANVLEQTLTINVLDVVEGETLANWKVRNNIGNLGQMTTGDGLTALQKYAFGLDPTLPSALPGQVHRTAMTDGQDYLTVTFPRAFGGITNPDGSYTYAGLIYRVEWSDDLVNWSSAGVAIVASGPAPGSPPGYRLVMARSPVPLPAQPRQFLRVLVGAN